MTATWCLLELCRHPEYIEELMAEAVGNSVDDPEWVRNSTTKMPKIDSFICEVSRIHPPSTCELLHSFFSLSQSFNNQRSHSTTAAEESGTFRPE